MKWLGGKTLPEAFYLRYKYESSKNFFYSKKNNQWVGTTYQEAFEFILKTMAGLKRLGFQAGQKIVIFSENREEWILTDYAAQWLGGATAAIYTTSTSEQIEYILNESEGVVLFTSNETLVKKLKVLKLDFLRSVVMWDEIKESVELPFGIQLISRENFLQETLTENEALEGFKALSEENLCFLLYTSGTTGEPKGVMLTHKNIITNVQMILQALPPFHEDKIVLSFLPLSHIYERIFHNVMILIGFPTYFAESVEKVVQNLAEVRPQIMTSVPRIFEKMYLKIMEKTKMASLLKRGVFQAALWIGKKTRNFRYQKRPLLFGWKILFFCADQLVFKKIRSIMGGRAELFMSGGAPLSREISEFFFQAGFTILEGYGTSEGCILSANRLHRFKFGTVGIPLEELEIKIASDGEILVRGPQVMKGYFKRPDATAEVLDAEGYYHTGDIGEFDEDGFLKITDRKKDLIVTAGGKKIAPQPIENELKKDPLIDSICLVGDEKKYIVALIVPNFELSEREAKRAKRVEKEWLEAHFKKIIYEINKTLPSYSTIKNFKLLSQPFTQEGGELTPTLKLKRRVIQKKYQNIISEMYHE